MYRVKARNAKWACRYAKGKKEKTAEGFHNKKRVGNKFWLERTDVLEHPIYPALERKHLFLWKFESCDVKGKFRAISKSEYKMSIFYVTRETRPRNSTEVVWGTLPHSGGRMLRWRFIDVGWASWNSSVVARATPAKAPPKWLEYAGIQW